MKVRVGQIRLPDPKAGANLLPAAVDLTTIGIMVPVPVEVPVPIVAVAGPLPVIPAKASAVAAVPGSTMPLVPAATLLAALLLPLIAHPPPAAAVLHLALVHPAITGCRTAVGGVCPTAVTPRLHLARPQPLLPAPPRPRRQNRPPALHLPLLNPLPLPHPEPDYAIIPQLGVIGSRRDRSLTSCKPSLSHTCKQAQNPSVTQKDTPRFDFVYA